MFNAKRLDNSKSEEKKNVEKKMQKKNNGETNADACELPIKGKLMISKIHFSAFDVFSFITFVINFVI